MAVSYGKISERSLYTPLSNYLGKLGYESVVNTRTEGDEPDILSKINGFDFVIETKIGTRKTLLDGIVQADKYMKKTGIRNAIIIAYPLDIKKPYISKEDLEHLTTKSKVNAIVLTQYWSTQIECKVSDLFLELKKRICTKKAVTDINFVVKTISEAINELSYLLRSYSASEIKNLINLVVGRFDLFLALGELDKERGEQKLKSATIDLVSYLGINQILFYHIYGVLTQKVPVFTQTGIKDLNELEDKFRRIRQINYDAIYSLDIISGLPKDKRIIDLFSKIVKAVWHIRPEQVKHDLLGRLFHELLPYKTRKILAAFYTNPIAGDILAGMTIRDGNETVLDPACGSGTLLISAYRKKMQRKRKNLDKKALTNCHKRFVESEISGTDIMPFATHLTAVNLSSQNIDITTNKLRVGIADSLDLSPGTKLEPFSKQIQLDLTDYKLKTPSLIKYTTRGKSKGAISLQGKGKPFTLEKVDVIIMNPPFTDREKMPKDFRDKLLAQTSNPAINQKISNLTLKCGKQINLWGYFIALADDFLKENGKLSTVIPMNILRGKATGKTREFILQNYTINYIFKSNIDIGFSEGAAFKDILLVATKRKPEPTDRTRVILLKKSLNELSLEDADEIERKVLRLSEEDSYSDNTLETYTIQYSDLLENKTNLMPLFSLKTGRSRGGFDKFLKMVRGSGKLTKIKGDLVKEGFHASPAGLSELVFITRPIGNSRLKRAFLILDRVRKGKVEIHIKNSNFKFKIENSKLIHALRTLTEVDTFNVSKNCDYLVTSDFPGFSKVLDYSKWKDKEKFNWNLVKKNLEGKETHILLARRFRPNSNNTHMFAFCSKKPVIAPDTFKIMNKFNYEESKLQCLLLNSIVGLVNVVRLRERTTEEYTDIRGSDLVQFDVFDISKLDVADKNKLDKLYGKLKDVKFPSIMEQLKTRYWARVELDTEVLKLLGLSKEKIKKELPKLYNIITSELEE